MWNGWWIVALWVFKDFVFLSMKQSDNPGIFLPLHFFLMSLTWCYRDVSFSNDFTKAKIDRATMSPAAQPFLLDGIPDGGSKMYPHLSSSSALHVFLFIFMILFLFGFVPCLMIWFCHYSGQIWPFLSSLILPFLVFLMFFFSTYLFTFFLILKTLLFFLFVLFCFYWYEWYTTLVILVYIILEDVQAGFWVLWMLWPMYLCDIFSFCDPSKK